MRRRRRDNTSTISTTITRRRTITIRRVVTIIGPSRSVTFSTIWRTSCSTRTTATPRIDTIRCWPVTISFIGTGKNRCQRHQEQEIASATVARRISSAVSAHRISAIVRHLVCRPTISRISSAPTTADRVTTTTDRPAMRRTTSEPMAISIANRSLRRNEPTLLTSR